MFTSSTLLISTLMGLTDGSDLRLRSADDSRYPEWEPGKAYSYGISIGVPQGRPGVLYSVGVSVRVLLLPS